MIQYEAEMSSKKHKLPSLSLHRWHRCSYNDAGWTTWNGGRVIGKPAGTVGCLLLAYAHGNGQGGLRKQGCILLRFPPPSHTMILPEAPPALPTLTHNMSLLPTSWCRLKPLCLPLCTSFFLHLWQLPRSTWHLRFCTMRKRCFVSRT